MGGRTDRPAAEYSMATALVRPPEEESSRLDGAGVTDGAVTLAWWFGPPRVALPRLRRREGPGGGDGSSPVPAGRATEPRRHGRPRSGSPGRPCRGRSVAACTGG